MKFHIEELPVAEQMIRLSEQANHPFQEYFCLWVAFNNIYVQVGTRCGMHPKYRGDDFNEVVYGQRDGYFFPRVKTVKESELIEVAVSEIDENIKEDLIQRPQTDFFAHRRPKGINTDFDQRGQRINGVLNLTRTVDINYPTWSPICLEKFEAFLAGHQEFRDELAKQIVFLLYTVRNNLVHGNKSPDEANDLKVVENALPLLRLLVDGFFNHATSKRIFLAR